LSAKLVLHGALAVTLATVAAGVSRAHAQPVELHKWAGEPADAPALTTPLSIPSAVAVDGAGRVYVSTGLMQKIYRVEPTTGRAVHYVGSGITDDAALPSEGSALAVWLGYVADIEVDSAGNLYFTEFYRGTLRRVDAGTGLVTTVVSGGGSYSWWGLGRDAAGNLFVTDQAGVLRIDAITHATSVVTTLGGMDVAVDPAGNLLVSSGDVVYKVAAGTAAITTFAGGGTGGDGGPAETAGLQQPEGLSFDVAGNLYIAETGAHRVRVVDTAGIIRTLAGNGIDGFTGDGGDARQASVGRPYNVAVDGAGSVYVATSGRVRWVDLATGVIATVAGNGEWRFGGDGGPRNEATFYYPAGAVAGAGGVVVADRDNRRVRRIDGATDVVTSLAGPNLPLCAGAFSPLSGSDCPASITVDSTGNVYATDLADARIRRIAAGSGAVTDFAGNGTPGASGDGGPATAASIGQPLGLATDAAGHLFFADFTAHRVRRVDASTGVITTLAGTGGPGYGGDGGSARSASLSSPAGVAIDGRGNVYVADRDNHRIRRIDTAGVITTVAGNGTQSYGGDGGPAVLASLSLPISVAADASGNLAIADQGNNRVRRVDAATGVITTIAGDGAGGLRGVGGLAVQASISAPRAVFLDAAGDLMIVDQLHHRILQVGPPTAGRKFYTIAPCRLLDTREPAGPGGGPALSPDVDRAFVVAGRCQIPTSAKGASLNVTVVGASVGGDLRFYPGGGFVPSASIVNYAAGQTRANNAVLGLGAGGELAVKTDQPGGPVHLIVDVNGYFE